MLKNILALSSILTREQQKLVNGGYFAADPDGEKEEGNLCNKTGPAKNRCGSGLYCDTSGIRNGNIGICKKKEASISQF